MPEPQIDLVLLSDAAGNQLPTLTPRLEMIKALRRIADALETHNGHAQIIFGVEGWDLVAVEGFEPIGSADALPKP